MLTEQRKRYPVVFLPGVKKHRGVLRNKLRPAVIQFQRLFMAWLAELEGVRLFNSWQRDFWQPPAEALAGLPENVDWQAVGAAIHIGATTSALGFLDQLKAWMADKPNIRLAKCRFGILKTDRGDTLTAIFIICEEDGAVRMRPRPRRRLFLVKTDEPSGSLVV